MAIAALIVAANVGIFEILEILLLMFPFLTLGTRSSEYSWCWLAGYETSESAKFELGLEPRRINRKNERDSFGTGICYSISIYLGR